MKKILNLLIKLSTAYFLISSAYIVSTGFVEENDLKSNIALVLGNKVEFDGSPSDRLRARLDQALILYQANLVQKIIVSGGIGQEGFDEAKVMKDYLIDKGMDPNDIVEDNQGYTTERSAKNLKVILNANFKEPILVISQYYHLNRAAYLVKNAGFLNVKTSYARYFEFRDFYSIFRETVALPYVMIVNVYKESL